MTTYAPVTVRNAGGLALELWERGLLDYEGAQALIVLQREHGRYRDALVACAAAAGADVSAGPPTSPDVDEWALRAVRELREDYEAA